MMLCGSGEFTSAMDAIDGALLARLRPHARVAIVPTAAGQEDTDVTEIIGGDIEPGAMPPMSA